MSQRELYISIDVEADGPIPGPYSLVSLGASVAALREPGQPFQLLDPDTTTWYGEFAPISDRWDREALAVSGLSRTYLENNGQQPQAGMQAFSTWVLAQAQQHQAKPVMVAYPAVYDWTWVYWYCINFVGSSVFGFNGCLDLKSFIASRGDLLLKQSQPEQIPDSPLSPLPTVGLTHNARQDAIDQARLFGAATQWAGAVNQSTVQQLVHDATALIEQTFPSQQQPLQPYQIREITDGQA